jgi:CheY-like chemotaxis protein
MIPTLFVKVVGFSDVERHALNSLFRLSLDPSSQRVAGYALWEPNAPAPAQLALMDGADIHSLAELKALDTLKNMRVIWVGTRSPSAKVVRMLERPLHWPDVLRAMDEACKASQGISIELENIQRNTVTPTLAATALSHKRALLAGIGAPDKTYLWSKLLSTGNWHIDEATTLSFARSLLQAHRYDFVVIDLAQRKADFWQTVRLAAKSKAMVLLIGNDVGMTARVFAKLCGASAAMQKPLEPNELLELLLKA